MYKLQPSAKKVDVQRINEFFPFADLCDDVDDCTADRGMRPGRRAITANYIFVFLLLRETNIDNWAD